MKLRGTSLFVLFFVLFTFSACRDVTVTKNDVNTPTPVAPDQSSPYKNVSTYLSNLVSSEGTITPSLSKTNFVYNVGLGYAVSSVKITPTAESTTAVIKVNGVKVNSGEASSNIPTSLGVTQVNITVERPDGTEQKTYAVLFSKTSGDAFLGSLSVTPTPVSFSPTFDKIILPYTVKVSNITMSVTVTATAEHSNATVNINGVQYGNSGTTTLPVNLGDNIFLIIVKPQDVNAPTNTYVLTVRRLSNNANLDSIKMVSQGVPSVLAPVPLTHNWSLPFTTTLVTVSAELEDSNSKLELNGTLIFTSTNYLINIPLQFPLVTNLNFKVTAEDGTEKTYDIRFTKESVVYLYSGGETTGAMGGWGGAKNRCYQNIPDNLSNLCTIASPVISTSAHQVNNMPSVTGLPANRKIVDSTAAYVVANTFSDLLTQPLITTLSDAHIMPGATGDFFWTGSNQSGTLSTGNNCNDYTVSNITSIVTPTTSTTLFAPYSASCNSTHNVYLLCACW